MEGLISHAELMPAIIFDKIPFALLRNEQQLDSHVDEGGSCSNKGESEGAKCWMTSEQT